MMTLAIILGLLITPLLLSSLVNRQTGGTAGSSNLWGCIGIALVFGFTGVGHFILTAPMSEMLPPWVPWRIPLIYVTGVIELAVAFAVLVPRLRWIVGWAIILMLVLFLPVNVYAAMHHIHFGGHEWGPVYLLVRIPLQAILVGWTWWFAVRPATKQPICFSCETTLKISPQQIAAQILDLAKWPEFQGYGMLPGIRVAEFEVKTPQVVGSKVRVLNTDGSSHLEEIVEWEPDRRLRLHMHEFSPPLSGIATAFDETWEFERSGSGTKLIRSFDMYATSAFSRPLVWAISWLLKKSIARHLRQMRG